MKQSMKKKLKIFTSIPLLAGIFIIIYASLGMVYFNKHDKSNDLASQIAAKQAILQKPIPNIKELNSQLSDAKAELETITTSLPYPGQGIDVYNILVDLSRRWNVEILNISASTPILPNDIEAVPTMPYSLTIKGSQDNTLGFISNLIEGREMLQGLEVQNIHVQGGASSSDPVTIALNLNIHTWPDFTSGTQDTGQTSGGKK